MPPPGSRLSTSCLWPIIPWDMGAGLAGHDDILPAALVEVGDPNLQADSGAFAGRTLRSVKGVCTLAAQNELLACNRELRLLQLSRVGVGAQHLKRNIGSRFSSEQLGSRFERLTI